MERRGETRRRSVSGAAAGPRRAARAGAVAFLAFAAIAASAAPLAADGVAIQVLPMRGAVPGDRLYVPVVVEVSRAALGTTAASAASAPGVTVAEVGGEAAGGEEPPTVEVLIHAFGADGAVVDSAAESVELTAGTSGVKLLGALALPPGAYTVRALARDGAGAELGVTVVEVEVPAQPVLIPPLVPELGDAWIVAHGRRPDLDALALPSPFFVREQPFTPSARPVLDRGQALPVVLMGYGLAGHEAGIDAEVADTDGRVVTGTHLVISPAERTPDGIDRTLGVLYLPALPAGDYVLRIAAEIAGSPHAVTQGFAVSGGEEVSRLLRIVAPQVPPPVVPAYDASALAAAAEAVPAQEVVEGYASILARLDTLDRDARIEALARFEIEAVGEDPESRIPRLRKSQLKVLRELAQRDRESLVPAIALHHDVCLAHRAGRQTRLMHHGIEMVREIAALYAPNGSSAGSRLVAAQALASLGGHIQAGGSRAGLPLYEAALEYDPDHAAALFGLAADPEKRGGPYDRAVRYLERLVAAHPGNREGRLRLAINRLRLGEETDSSVAAKARAELEALVEGAEADWIYILAAQELARARADGGDLAGAIAVLRKARARIPDAQKLGIQLAFLLDRAGRGPEALRVLAGLRADHTGIAPARGRYNQWPSQALMLDREALADGAERRRELLVEVAQASGLGGGG